MFAPMRTVIVMPSLPRMTSEMSFRPSGPASTPWSLKHIGSNKSKKNTSYGSLEKYFQWFTADVLKCETDLFHVSSLRGQGPTQEAFKEGTRLGPKAITENFKSFIIHVMFELAFFKTEVGNVFFSKGPHQDV